MAAQSFRLGEDQPSLDDAPHRVVVSQLADVAAAILGDINWPRAAKAGWDCRGSERARSLSCSTVSWVQSITKCRWHSLVLATGLQSHSV
jgi:hypothetical protein